MLLNKFFLSFKNKIFNKNISTLLTLIYFPLSIFYMEVIFRLIAVDDFFSLELFFIFMFSVVFGLILTLISTIFTEKINRWISTILTFWVTLIYAIQLVYFHVFKDFLILYSFTIGSDILQFWKTILQAILEKAPAILLISLPFIFNLIFSRKHLKFPKFPAVKKLALAAFAAFMHILTVLIILSSNTGAVSPRYLYRESFIPTASVEKFGLLTTARLDLRFLLFSYHDDSIDEFLESLISSSSQDNSSENDSDSSSDNEGSEPQVPEKKYNIMDIDFSSLISNETDQELLLMHKYFSAQAPSQTNEYTGIFKGKNLIFITAEGFSPYAIDKELTPTLYKMQEEGFKFTNFYTPSWWVSTSDGEYVACTGLIPKSGVWSFSKSSSNYLPFCMGNQFNKLGIESFAYHNNTYTYYNRHLSHPNMGYVYKGLGNGLEVTKTWPQSDLEMINLSAQDFIGKERFNVYYMTVSGHMLYTFKDNYIAYKNRELVSHLTYSDNVKAYLACSIELDLAMKRLLEILNEAGVADDTVIVISPDHYPYGLTNEEISELAGHEIETNFEIYKGVLLIYSQGMEKPVLVDKPASSLDIIPTISNLLGLEYDSRLLAGSDILSCSPPLVIFSNRSWITDKGRFNAKNGKFEPFENMSISENYVEYINEIVNYKFKMSQKILERDYYGKIFQSKSHS